MKKIAVFDLDGTLIDSMERFEAGMLHVLMEENIPFPEDFINVLTPLGYTKSAELFVKMGVKDSVSGIVSRIEKFLVNEYANHIRLKPGVYDYVNKLKRDGAKMYVLTASPHIVTDVCLKNNGIYDLFEQVWSVEDFGLSKSDVAIFYEVAQEIGCEPDEIHYFDDNYTALINAGKAGYCTYGVLDRQSEEDVNKVRENSQNFVSSFENFI